MQTAGNRWVKRLLDALIAVSTAIFIYVFTFGGVELFGGRHVPGCPGVRFSCNKLGTPFLFLCAAILLRLILSRPAPIRRFIGWTRRNIRTLSLAALVAAAAAAPRLWDLGGHSLAPDELLWIDYGQRLISHLRVHEFRKATAHLSYPGVIPAAITGASYCYLGIGAMSYSRDLLPPLITVRLPVACLGIAACVLLYLLARLLIGDAAAFWGSLLLALLPEQVADSRVALVDAVLTPFLTGSVLCYAVGELRGRVRWKVASALLWSGALLTKDPACLVPLILLAWKGAAWLLGRRERRRAANDLLWLGLGMAAYLLLYTKLWCDPRGLDWGGYAKFLPLTNTLIRAINAVALLPWLQVTGAALGATLISAAAGGRSRDRLRALWTSRPAVRAAATALLAGAFVQAFHIPLVNELLHLAGSYRLGDMGHLKYWMGRVTIHPPAWFYLFMLLVCTPPLTVLLLVAGIVRSGGAVLRREDRWPAVLLLVVVPAVYLASMSMGHKMAIRYADGVFPFLCALAGVGLAEAVEALGRVPAVSRGGRRTAAAPLLAGIAVAAFLVPPLLAVAPDYEMYCNFIVGGPAGAARLISIGFGAGINDAAAYLKARAADDDAVGVVGFHPEFIYHWEHDPPKPPPGVLIGRTAPPHLDWLVVPLGHRMRGLAAGALRGTPRRTLAHSVEKCGVDVVDIYRVEDPPHSSPQRYRPDRLLTACGTRVADPLSPSRAAVASTAGRKGMLAYGPFERFAAGRWRATFSLASGAAAPDAAVARLSIAGVSPGDVVQSAALRRRDFMRSDGYRNFAVDFRLQRAHRLQFCVDDPGATDLRVGEVRVEPEEARP